MEHSSTVVPKRSEGIKQQPAGAAKAASDDTGFTPVLALSMEADGAALHKGAAVPCLAALEAALSNVATNQPGIRLTGLPKLADVLAQGGAIAAIAATYLGASARPVRAVLFDKTPAANWALGWHQDRTIAVQAQHEVAGFGPWTRKAGLLHVEPPFAVIEAMVTLRIHLEVVPADNAPLLIARRSHRIGRIPVREVETIVARSELLACVAERGDVWVYATPILHASAASNGRRRRVLQVDYSAQSLPAPLEWLGV
ncbi:phytanoyl-CoA dioxygenase family protein [Sphingomonas donggukensis]|uniref:Phytanoyl-CoA dioxygenase family protein n=1 Tax=Sphingomonas donggukensis TaxID=2949093 RepID=A0ABY4TS67_9SPHN|nr:phytanoyl-CoA dioxygenase family protein [Sphingomonas donggukensis]URW75230.1 phytanoyl-CoA dioxygenase family protein [Sphingomonas donggukensis]